MKFSKMSALLGLCALMTAAQAGEIRPFNQNDFDTLTHNGKAVVLDVSAPWCPTCKAQKPIVDGLMKQSAYKDVTLMTLDFDSAKATLRQFNVNMQSTLVAFKGDKEVGRSVGDTTSQGLEALFKKTLR